MNLKLTKVVTERSKLIKEQDKLAGKKGKRSRQRFQAIDERLDLLDAHLEIFKLDSVARNYAKKLAKAKRAVVLLTSEDGRCNYRLGGMCRKLVEEVLNEDL